MRWLGPSWLTIGATLAFLAWQSRQADAATTPRIVRKFVCGLTPPNNDMVCGLADVEIRADGSEIVLGWLT